MEKIDNIHDVIVKKLETIPSGFGVDEVDNWVKNIPIIDNINSIRDILIKINTPNEYFAIQIILRRKYINPIKNSKLNKNRYIDFSKYEKNNKLVLFNNRICEKITINNGSLELFSIINSPKLDSIEIMENSLKYFEIIKCNNLFDFRFIKKLNGLIILNLSDNKRLSELDFFPKNNNIAILQLIATNVLKLPKTVYYLKKLERLKSLDIKATKKEIEMLQKELPNCIINGIK